VINYKPPPLPTLLELLLQMTDCRVSTDCRGGNPTGEGKLDKLKKSLEKKKGGKRGPDIVLRRQYNMERL